MSFRNLSKRWKREGGVSANLPAMSAELNQPEVSTVTRAEGLTGDEVAERVAKGLVNESGERTSRTFSEILRGNVFTRFNAILTTMFVIIVIVGPLQDGLFMGIVVANSLIGIVQEVRAKRTLDKLAILSAPKARVIRESAISEVSVESVVLDDLLELRTGDQVPADGIVRTVDGLEIDESLLTGESDPIDKQIEDEVLSGSFVVAGSGRFQATRVGGDAFARKLASEARRFALTRSELMDGINRILRLLTWTLFPVAAALLWSQLRTNDFFPAARSMVAGVVGMVPQGLVLLTSIAFAVAAVSLARRHVLVQELPAVEGLARVDVVCLDKTGTLTEGIIDFERLVPLDPEANVGGALAALAADENRNATTAALAEEFPFNQWERTGSVAFSSARKWSASSFRAEGTWVIGAPEMVLSHATPQDPVRAQANELAATGRRVLLLAHTDEALNEENLPGDLRPAALVLFEERVRPDARDTLRYFTEQGVTLKVISGDNPRTVGAVASRVGLESAEDPIDARELPDNQQELAEVLEHHSVFGRVSPQQKRAMVGALQSRGHVVAMTGDGVNDALALKDADIGVAMGSGAPATRATAQLVLLDGKFATMPGVVAEGRRVIANIERVANLFVTKTVYSILIALSVVATEIFLVRGWSFPFLPRHLTLIGDLTIGIPAFFLSLAPNKQRYVPGFLSRVFRFAIPAGILAATATMLAYGLARAEDASLKQSRTTATLVLLVVGLGVLVLLARPFSIWRGVLVGFILGAASVVLAVPAFRDFFALDLPRAIVLVQAGIVAAGALVLLEIGWQASRKFRAPRRQVGGA